jgi:4-amino-4-deoxy-L-arabinose transferase-like glycosyltransferase
MNDDAPLPVPPLRWVLLIFALPLAAFFLRLGGAPLFDVDEGAFSEATREMFERGDFLSTYLNGEPRFDKPILIYWLQALNYLLFGASEWAFRLPSALAAACWSYATWAFARERFGANTALAALAVAATALGPFAIGRAATADALLNLLIALALFDAWRHLESGRRAPLLRSFVWIGLGVLTKGPIAVLVPGAVTFLYCATRGEWKLWVRTVFDPVGLAILAVLVVPWYAAALVIHGQAFIDGFIFKHNVARFTGTLEGHAGSLFYYVLAVPLLLLPWTGPLLASLRHARADWATGARRFLWLWAAFVVAFFSLSGTKLPHYALYGATPLFLLIAAHRNTLQRAWLHLAAPTAFLLLLPLLPLVFQQLSVSTAGNAYYRAQLSLALGEAGHFYYLVTLGALALWLVLALRWTAATWLKLTAGAAIQVVALGLVVVPWIGAVLQGPVKEAGLRAKALDEPVVAWRFTAPSFSVYREAVTPDRPPEAGELALARVDRVPADGYETLYSRGGVALVRRQPE